MGITAITKPGIWKIINLFYANQNSPLHLREISRKVNLNESSVSRHLNELLKNKILNTESEGNLKKFYVNFKFIPLIFPIYDSERLNNLDLLRKNAIKEYINSLEIKPSFIILFGSTAKDTPSKDSDIDVLFIGNKTNNSEAIKKTEAQTGIRIQEFILNEEKFKDEIKLKKDNLIQSAIITGFPVFNEKYYYEVVYSEE